jgi:3-phenylpropionate/trans-cinnamate dioxygenase ferredoxin subunit
LRSRDFAANRQTDTCAPTQRRRRQPNEKKMSNSKFTAVATLEDVPAGTKKVVAVNGMPVLLCHTDDRIFAIRNECSHAHEALDCGRMKYGWISCPVHGARFDLETGEPLNPPATEPLQTFEVRIVGETIEVAV